MKVLCSRQKKLCLATCSPGLQATLPPLDAVRSIACLSIVLFHTNIIATFALTPETNKVWRLKPLTAALNVGATALDVFFLLTGFLLATEILRQIDKPIFSILPSILLRRLVRLWPSLIVVVCIGYLLGEHTPSSPFSLLFFFWNYLRSFLTEERAIHLGLPYPGGAAP